MFQNLDSWCSRHKSAALVLIISSLVACGGGAPTPATTTTPAEPDVLVEMALTNAAPNDDLQAATNTPASTAANTVCAYPVGTSKIVGLVSSVHDGDTITVNGNSIRLDSIDAPELTQTYGTQSQKALASLILGKSVTVAYNKKDKYGRIVGAVFTDGCQYVNLTQVSIGAAWFYRAYQCEISASARNAFDKAESVARETDLGLWSGIGAATPPWIYRNGTDATVPTCSSDVPTWSGNQSASTPPPSSTTPVVTPPVSTSPPTTTPISTAPKPGSCYVVWVNGYTRTNGTRVAGYYRKSPGCP
jgi:endonuclease YncB( thermonuclease family)